MLGLVAVTRHTPAYRTVVAEDGVLEGAQVVGFAIAAWALLSAAARATGVRRVRFAALGMLTVAVIGEELAWGTRLLGTGIGFVEAHNEQGDTTLHNLAGGLEASFLAIAVLSVGLAAMVAAKHRSVRSAPLALAWWLAIPACYATFRLGAGDVPYHVSKFSEAVEAVFAVAVARLAIIARRESEPSSLSGS